KKKYGDTVDDILKYRENAAGEVAGIERAGEEASELAAEAERAQAGLMEAARELSVQRKKGADGFAGKVQSELADMGMPRAVFGVTFTELDEPGPRGFEKAEFMFSANPGKEPLPLAKVASGGELSRVMLALRVILSREDSVPTLVFDEVDSGVGGVTAGAVGRKLRSAADGRQVLCITHLPQIASLAREHFTVEKRMDGAGVKVLVRRLDKRERVDELARMLGGEGSKTASAHAEELVRQGEG
ncbi:MAG TPA: DNA repair protein RecN, partial [Nitrospirota bacterium]